MGLAPVLTATAGPVLAEVHAPLSYRIAGVPPDSALYLEAAVMWHDLREDLTELAYAWEEAAVPAPPAPEPERQPIPCRPTAISDLQTLARGLLRQGAGLRWAVDDGVLSVACQADPTVGTFVDRR